VTGQASTILVYTILGFQTIIAIGFHHICWWSSYHLGGETTLIFHGSITNH
jgi:hypothetical protein